MYKKILYLILSIILIGTIILIIRDSQNDKIEGLSMNYLDDPELLLLQRYNDDLDDDNTSDQSNERIHKNVVNYFKVSDFIQLVFAIQQKIADMLINYAKTCTDQNGYDMLGDGKSILSLNCITNPQEIEDAISLEIFKIIHKYIYDKYKINLNFHAVMFDIYNQLGLLEKAILPLMYSDLYTINGIQYTTKERIIYMVDTNLPVYDVLYTITSRRNIVLDMDTDRSVQYADPMFSS